MSCRQRQMSTVFPTTSAIAFLTNTSSNAQYHCGWPFVSGLISFTVAVAPVLYIRL